MQLELVARKDKGPDGKPDKADTGSADAGSPDSSAATVPPRSEPARDDSNSPQGGPTDGGPSRGPRAEQRQGPNPFAAEVLARELNPAQTEAVVHPPGPLLILAGAGSGKTRVITYRIAHLVGDGRRPATHPGGDLHQQGRRRDARARRQAARASASRSAPVDRHLPRHLRAPAAHATPRRSGCARTSSSTTTTTRRRCMTRVLKELSVAERLFPPRAGAVAHRPRQEPGASAPTSSRADDYFDDVGRARPTALPGAAARGQRGRLRRPAAEGAAPVRADSPAGAELAERFDHVLVDEFQDTNQRPVPAGAAACRARTHNLAWSATTTSRIYRWRGADMRNILDFERDYPGATVVKLEQNYRSTADILDAANASSRATPSASPSASSPRPAAASRSSLRRRDERDEAEFVVRAIADAAERRRGSAGTSPSSTAPTPSRACSKRRCGRRSAVRDRRRHAVLRSRRGQGSARVSARDRQPRRRAGAAADRQRSGARHRRHHRREGRRASRTSGKISAWQALRARAADAALLGAAPRKKLAAFVELMRGCGAGASALGAGGAGRAGPRARAVTSSGWPAEARMRARGASRT